MQKPAIKIAVLKPRATFGHGVAKKLITDHGINAEIVFYGNNLEVCRKLAEGETDMAVVPLENNIAGLVPDWITWCNEEARTPLGPRAEIIHEIVSDVGQCLLVRPGVSKECIKKILSHERALKQCSTIIARLGVPTMETNSTAAAAELVSTSAEIEGYAALAAETAAEEYGLEILQRDAEDQVGNVTRFGILQLKEKASKSIPFLTKDTSIKRVIVRFGLPNTVGALHAVTAILLKHHANMTSLRDLPQGLAKRYSYSFYMEYDIKASETAASILALKQITENLTVFGNFFVEDRGL
ncbi:MAG: prephenate dehydratase domain-containing protein [Patescibacteria group bacterium]